MVLTPKITLLICLIIFMFILSFILERLISKQENPWLGLILPTLSFICALFWGIGKLIAHRNLTLDVVLKDFLLFSAFNFATVIHLIIYFVCRKIKPKEEEKDDTEPEDTAQI